MSFVPLIGYGRGTFQKKENSQRVFMKTRATNLMLPILI